MGLRRLTAAWLAMCIVAGSTYAAQPGEAALPENPGFISRPTWITRPSAAEVDQAAPPAIVAARQGGGAVTECRIDSTGRLHHCAVLAESPARSGVGEAALGLMSGFRMQAFSEDGLPTEGAVINVPLAFNVPGQAEAPAPLHYAAGEEAYLVNRSAEGKPVGKIVCPTTQEPRRKCYLHALKWRASPDFVQRAVQLRKIGRTSGRTLVECAVDAEGQLTACDATADMVAPKKEALMALMTGFRAEAASDDEQPLSSGRVLVGFDWETLNRAANASSLTRLDAPTRPIAVSLLTSPP